MDGNIYLSIFLQTDPFTFISGHGSDHIFMRPPSKKSVSDYLIEKGLKDYKETVGECGTILPDPLYSIFKENARSCGSHFILYVKKRETLKNF